MKPNIVFSNPNPPKNLNKIKIVGLWHAHMRVRLPQQNPILSEVCVSLLSIAYLASLFISLITSVNSPLCAYSL